MKNYEETIEKLKKYKQNEIVNIMSKVYTEEENERLIEQLNRIDLNQVMNLYRNVDREKIQFDFLVFGDGIFDKEINQLGGKIYYMKYLTEIGQIKFKKHLIEFMPEYKEEALQGKVEIDKLLGE